MSLAGGLTKRLFVGRPLRSTQLSEQELPKKLALPIFCSDPISSVAYATEQIVLVLALGGVAFLSLASWVAVAVAVLLAIVVISYRQTCFAYPNGGGAFVVSKTNLGEAAALTAAAALLVDYVMTVAVSVVSGVVAIISAVPSLAPHSVALSVAFVLLLVLGNLRGLRESGTVFAVPTYAFIAGTYLMLIVALVRALTGGLPEAATAHDQITASAHTGGLLTLFLVLRAFASGCTALTGVEAISNGVPAFKKPKSKNAAATLVVMGALAISMFGGITVLAVELKARAHPDGNPSVISQLAAAIFGGHSVLFYFYQAATAAILVLAANTAFNGFPLLSSVLAADSYLPRQLRSRGDRLVYSNGILLLAGFAIALIVGFNANIDKLIQLYILGVFTSFTLSQFGMVRHWQREIPGAGAEVGRMRRAQLINGTGAAVTFVVLLIVLATKFSHGAWLAVVAMVVLFVLMKGIHSHYESVRSELLVPEDELLTLPARNHAIVLVSQLHLPTMRTLAYARGTRPSSIEALTVNVDGDATERLETAWRERGISVPLTVVDSPYRETTKPIIEYVRRYPRGPRDVLTVFIPEYVMGHWWEQLLHNQTALRLKGRLLFQPGVMVTSVPWQLRSSEGREPELVASAGRPDS